VKLQRKIDALNRQKAALKIEGDPPLEEWYRPKYMLRRDYRRRMLIVYRLVEEIEELNPTKF
jgi:hypothetical protein